MKLTYFENHIPNFGDELNKIMWDSLIEPTFFDEDKSTLFLGVGSILWDYLDPSAKKIVMGSGYGGYSPKPDMHDGMWDVAFVRGPRTAKLLKLDPKLAVTDAAILTRFMKFEPQKKKYKVSFMPHFESIPRGNWERVCECAGIHYITPTNPDVKATLLEILQSDLLLTEAMHGAILADTLRVPWVALEPISSIHHNKWYDWTESMAVDLKFNVSPNSSFRDLLVHKTDRPWSGKLSQQLEGLLSFTDSHFINAAAEQLLKYAKMQGQMSDESVFITKSDMALDKLSQYCPIKSL